VELGADQDLDGDHGGNGEVDRQAERRPPPRSGDDRFAVLLGVLHPGAGLSAILRFDKDITTMKS
jgi:hypothetical protein